MSSTAQELYDSLRSYLQVSYKLVGKEGLFVNPGETCKVRITVSNTGPNTRPLELSEEPRIVFRNVRVQVHATAHAGPVGGTPADLVPADQVLHPGESTHVDVELSVGTEISPTLIKTEYLATAVASADVDLASFFHLQHVAPILQSVVNPMMD